LLPYTDIEVILKLCFGWTIYYRATQCSMARNMVLGKGVGHVLSHKLGLELGSGLPVSLFSPTSYPKFLISFCFPSPNISNMQTTRRSSWSITTSTPERPNLKRNNSEPLVPFPAVIFKPRMNGEIARLTNPNGSWSPLGVLLKPVPIQVIILKMLTRNDIM
jgi:hypothetical protein